MSTDKGNIHSANDEEFRSLLQNADFRRSAKDLLDKSIDEMRIEISRTERFLDQLSVRSIAYISLAQLITLLSLGISLNKEFIRVYLIWIFPILLLSIFCFIKSLIRLNIARTNFPILVTKEGIEEIVILRMESKLIQDSWQKIFADYGRASFWYRLVLILTTLFIISYVVHFYAQIFGVSFNILDEFIVLFVNLAIGLLIYISFRYLKPPNITYEYKPPVGIINNTDSKTIAMNQPQQEQQIQIKASDEIMKGSYSNMMRVMYTPAGEEFLLDFMSVYPPAGSLNARVILSPGHMKRMVAALADNLAKYEKQFGPIKSSDAPTAAPIGFDAQ